MIRKILSIGLVVGSSICSNLNAVGVIVDTSKSVECVLSSLHQNRIAVRDGELSKIICLDERVKVEMEPDSGQAFVYAIDKIEKPVTLSCVTSSGIIQDLVATFSPVPSEVILLQEPIPLLTESELSQSRSDRVVSLLKAVSTNQVPNGFVLVQDAVERKRVGKFELKRTAVFRGPFERISVYEVKNRSNRTVETRETDWVDSSSEWVFLKDRVIQANKKTLLIRGDRV